MGDYAVAFANYENRMRDFVKKCQGIADGGTDWFVPRTRLRLWLSNQMWKISALHAVEEHDDRSPVEDRQLDPVKGLWAECGGGRSGGSVIGT